MLYWESHLKAWSAFDLFSSTTQREGLFYQRALSTRRTKISTNPVKIDNTCVQPE
jgi:hypothetical protein